MSGLKKFPVLLALVCLVAVIGLSGCKNKPVYNVTDAPVSGELTQAKIEKAIIRAGADRGWAVEKIKPGLMEATLRVRQHVAVVEIPYTDKHYSILYKSSQNLKYNASRGSIHRNYNNWIHYLDNSIRKELTLILN